jgi:hypothetical protein
MLVKLTLIVNSTNILRAAIPPIFLCQKTIKPNFKYKKSCVYNWCAKKGAHKIHQHLKSCFFVLKSYVHLFALKVYDINFLVQKLAQKLLLKYW